MLLSALFEKKKPGTYAGVRFTPATIKLLKKLQKDLDVPEPLSAEDFHSTLLYSTKHLPDYKPAGELNPQPVADGCKYKLEIWPSDGGTKNVLVLKYNCSWLEDRHEFLMDEHKAKWNHPDYLPHITLSYNVGDWKGKLSVELDEPITLSEEYREDLNDDW